MNLFEMIGRLLTKKMSLIDVFEDVVVYGENGKQVKIPVKIDTGAYRTSIDKTLAGSLGLLGEKNEVGSVDVKSALGLHSRKVVNITYLLGGLKVKTTASIADRSHMNFSMIIGRKDLGYFVVNYVPKNEIHI